MEDEASDNGCITWVIFALILSAVAFLALFGAAALLVPMP